MTAGLRDTTGSPLYAAMLSAVDIERSASFYRELCGLELLDEGAWSSALVTRHFGVPGCAARFALLGDPRVCLGQVFLVEYQTSARLRIRSHRDVPSYGLVNLNLYAEDIHATVSALEAHGFSAWSRPAAQEMASHIGAPTTATVEGPDGVLINLVELTTRDPETQIGRMRRFVAEECGYNARGLTSIVTTQHCVRDIELATRFYEAVLGMRTLIEDRFESESQNTTLAYPLGTNSRVRFLSGGHQYGKIALIQPLNRMFQDRAGVARPPHIGYLAQCFVVDDIERAVAMSEQCQAVQLTIPSTLHMPVLGEVLTCFVTLPGSDAMAQLIQRRGADIAGPAR